MLHFAAILTHSNIKKMNLLSPVNFDIINFLCLYNFQCGLHWVCVEYLGLSSPAPLLLFRSSAAVSPLTPQPHILSCCFSTEVTKVEERAGRSSWGCRNDLVSHVQNKKERRTLYLKGIGMVLSWHGMARCHEHEWIFKNVYYLWNSLLPSVYVRWDEGNFFNHASKKQNDWCKIQNVVEYFHTYLSNIPNGTTSMMRSVIWGDRPTWVRPE